VKYTRRENSDLLLLLLLSLSLLLLFAIGVSKQESRLQYASNFKVLWLLLLLLLLLLCPINSPRLCSCPGSTKQGALPPVPPCLPSRGLSHNSITLPHLGPQGVLRLLLLLLPPPPPLLLLLLVISAARSARVMPAGRRCDRL
jgi:hypothetical protein